ncbi:MAG TPA: hypothetical protein VEC37_14320 [Bacillota bacterium]|nr:hypothetical protein [Bacillota bacterium]
MKMQRWAVGMVLWLAVGSVWAWAATANFNGFNPPIYPGAVEDRQSADELAIEKPEQMLVHEGLALRSESYRAYQCSVPAEEVLQFYIQRLNAKQLNETPDPFKLQRGQANPVNYYINFYEDFDFQVRKDSSSGRVIYDGKKLKELLQNNRKTGSSKQWVKSANFDWTAREKNADLTAYSVTVSDRSFSEDGRTYLKTMTSVVIHNQTFKNEEDTSQDINQEMDKEIAERMKTLKQPTAQELGAPLYPGATFNIELSAGMSLSDDEVYYIFLSNDPPAKVTAFYEQKLGKKAANNSGKYVIALQGKLPLPDRGIFIEPNSLGVPGKTVIAFRQWAGNR